MTSSGGIIAQSAMIMRTGVSTQWLIGWSRLESVTVRAYTTDAGLGPAFLAYGFALFLRTLLSDQSILHVYGI